MRKVKLNDGIDYWELAQELGIRGVPTGDHLYANCPLHSERHPSFSLDLTRGLWYCHTEQRGGNFPQLVAEVRDVGIMAARRWIVEQSAKFRPVDKIEAEQPEPEDDIDWAGLAYHSGLTTAELPTYWFERGFTWETATAWDVRYDPLQRRLVIPVRFPFGGDFKGYVSRTVLDERPKYKNSSGLSKNALFLGYNAQPSSPVILLTEGPLDAIWLWQQGYEAWAVLGSTLSDAHWKLLRVLSKPLILAFDSDNPGRRASWKGIEAALNQNAIGTARVFRFPPGAKDVAECTPKQIEQGIRQAHIALGWSNNNGRTRSDQGAADRVSGQPPKRWQPKSLEQGR